MILVLTKDEAMALALGLTVAVFDNTPGDDSSMPVDFQRLRRKAHDGLRASTLTPTQMKDLARRVMAEVAK